MFLLLLACTAPPTFESGDVQVEVSDLDADVAEEVPTTVVVEATLSEPVATTIRCAAVDDPEELHTVDEPASTNPRAELYGLLAETEYRCGIGPVAGELAATVTVTTEAFDDPPAFRVEGDPAAMTGAYTLFNAGPTCDTATPQKVWIVDPEGRPRWRYQVPEDATGDIDASWLGDGRLLLGGGSGSPTRGDGILRILHLDGSVEYERTQPFAGDEYTHESQQLPSGEILSLVWDEVAGEFGEFYGFGLELLDPTTDRPTWQWSSQSAVAAGTLSSGTPSSDWFHANAARWFPDDPEGPSYWVSLAGQAEIVRIDAASGDVTWRLGLGRDFTLYDLSGEEVTDPDGWWEFQHAISVRAMGDKVLLSLHDNGYTRGWSRVLDLEVDPAARTARVVWEWSEAGWVERNGGDYDLLDGGHRLVTQGHCSCCEDSGDRESSITEVDPADGSVAWRLVVPGDNQYLYRSQRLGGCDLFTNQRYCAAEE